MVAQSIVTAIKAGYHHGNHFALYPRKVARGVHYGFVERDVGRKGSGRKAMDLEDICQRSRLVTLGVVDFPEFAGCFLFPYDLDPGHASFPFTLLVGSSEERR